MSEQIVQPHSASISNKTMTTIRRVTLAVILLSFGCAMAAIGWPAPPNRNTSGVATLDEIKEEFKSVPCKNSERLQAARDLMAKMGAPADSIQVQHYKKGGGVDDLVVVKPGATDEKIVIGAHYDKVVAGCGAIDNWTGVVTVAMLYKTFKDRPFKKTLEFVLFGKEESGLIGSAAMVGSFEKSELNQYCAMVNIDSLGLSAPQTADNMATRKLVDLAEVIAKNMKMPFSHPSIPGAGADSMSFIDRRIPAITISGLTSNWQGILHHDADQASRIDPRGVLAGYLLALNMVINIDQRPCDNFR